MLLTSRWIAASSASYRASFGQSGIASLRNYNARFCEWGHGRPLVIVPGLAGGYELLGPLVRQLSSHFRVISYQLRGEDDCFAMRQRFGLRDLVADLSEFVDWMGLERPLLCGVSFGGVLALQYAARHPRRVEKLAVQGVGVRFEKSVVQKIAGSVLSGYPLPNDSPFVNQFFNLLFGAKPPRPAFDFVTRQCWQTDQSVMAHRMQLLDGLDLAGDLGKLQCPLLHVSGTKDLFVSAASVQAVKQRCDDAETLVLQKAGHLAAVTHATPIAEAVERFMA